MDFGTVIESIKQVQPSLTAVANTGTALTTIGGWAVNLLQAGKKTNFFRVSREKKKKKTKVTDIALVVDVTWSISTQVVNYLEKKKIDAEVLLLVNNQKEKKGKWLPINKPKEWESAVRDFNAITQKIFGDSQLADARIHIFIAGPVALAYSIGAVWGTVHHAIVYQWDVDEKTYYPVINVSTKLKGANSK